MSILYTIATLPIRAVYSAATFIANALFSLVKRVSDLATDRFKELSAVAPDQSPILPLHDTLTFTHDPIRPDDLAPTPKLSVVRDPEPTLHPRDTLPTINSCRAKDHQLKPQRKSSSGDDSGNGSLTPPSNEHTPVEDSEGSENSSAYASDQEVEEFGVDDLFETAGHSNEYPFEGTEGQQSSLLGSSVIVVEPADPKTTLRTHLESIVETEQVQPLVDKFYRQFLEITTEGGPFEQKAEDYVRQLTDKTLVWESNGYDFDIKNGYIVISRAFSYAHFPSVKGQWAIPIDENDPAPSFSIDQVKNWRFRKFLSTFHHLLESTKNFSRFDQTNNLGQKLQLVMKDLHTGEAATNETDIFAAWQSFEEHLRQACVTAQDAKPNVKQTSLLNALVSAFYENPQREFHQFLHSSLIQEGKEPLNCGIKATFKAYEENKDRLGTNAVAVNDNKSVNDAFGYCNLLNIGRLPYPLITFDILDKQVVLYSMGTPTIEERTGECSIHPIFAHWKRLKEADGFKFIYNNLQPLQADTSTITKQVMALSAAYFGTKDESRRANALKYFLQNSFMAYPADGEWYNGGKDEDLGIEVVKGNALHALTNLTKDPIVAYPEEWKAYKETVKGVLELIADVFYPNQEFLSKDERKVFNELTKPFLVLIMLINHDPDIMSIVCRDGMDRAGMLIALTNLLIDIMKGNISVENKAKTTNSLYQIVERLCSTTFLTAEQAIEDGSGRRTRLLGCWKQLGLSLDKHEIEDASVLERLINHKTFKKLKEQLKIAE